MSTPDPRSTIPAALSSFQTLPLKDAARQFLAELGYKSDKFLAGAGSSPQAFLDLFAAGHPFDQAKAIVSEWKSADLLFQLTDQELNRESSLFTDDSVQRGLLKSYIFIAIELKGSEYPRGKFSAIARQINRLFPMPVMVFFKHQGRLTIAVINRRVNKLDESKDVLGKVTLISGIDLAQPHRGHLDILDSLALPNLVHPQKKPITDFDTLHAAWEQIFNVELLNERFYRELANWYFWALPQVEFPADLEADDEKRRATGLIRLLTRLIFCWFLKEKGLIPEKLFHPTDLDKILKGFDPESETSSTYYQAILQNLFFATLNQRMGKDAKGQPYRIFAKDEGFQRNRATYDVNNLYRYEALFQEEPDTALAHFADIPFLNGGLFECLDRTEESSPDNSVGDSSKQTETGLSRLHFKKRYLDGFSRNPKKRPHVPDRLFFDGGETADLSAAYGDTKRKAERVTGLIRILNRYKFTIVENTPIDQEIALDPELLGKVFENLLASYNEETKTTARKQTGSFYTPRPIVDYMVDESLKAHLERKVAETILSRSNPDKIVGATFQPYNPDAATEKTWQNLPHWSQEGTTYWITFRLADSLPQEKLNAWKAERDIWASHHPEPWSDSDWKEYHERFGERLENWLDVGEGECHLRRPEIRSLVEKGLTHFDGARYDLGPWIIMPNHVHMLLRPNKGQNLSKIMQGIKGVSAKECNSLLGRTGQPFWQEESFDHIVRSQAQFDRFIRYITENPRKAKLKEGEYQRSSDNQSSPDNPVGVSPDTTGTGLSRLRSRLDQLFSYTEQPHQFSEPEVAALVAAIDVLKILDPACGSGAFPMGVLHKLVYILGKLDPDNDRWKQTQLAKLDSAPMREELERAFADNADDYGRKLYLIENCLYGVDIQPIAIQITKLRFFISLVCDQKIQSSPDNPVGDSSKQSETRLSRLRSKNLGIRPLPNLETKFVAANTLIGISESEQTLFTDPRIGLIEKEIESLYHRYFSILRRSQKLELQAKVKSGRHQILAIIRENLKKDEPAILQKIQSAEVHLTLLTKALSAPATSVSSKSAMLKEVGQKQAEVTQLRSRLDSIETHVQKAASIAAWNPFDPQSRADFFDPHLMFGISVASGFDITIGNPPYVRADEQSEANVAQRQAILASNQYETLWEKWDLFVPFLERSYKLLRPNGVSTMIVSDAFCHSKYAQKAQNWFLKNARILRLDFCGEVKIFVAAVHNVITCFQKADGAKWKPERRIHRETFGEVSLLPTDEQAKLTNRMFFPDESVHSGFTVPTLAISSICYVSFGCRPNSDEKRAKGLFVAADLVSDARDKDHPKPYIEAKDITRWTYLQSRWLEWETARSPDLLTRPTFTQLYEVPEKIVAADVSGAENRAAYDCGKVFHSHTLISFVPWHSLHGVRNNSLKKSARYRGEKPQRLELPRREELEATSRRFAVKYLLGVMNSGSARDFLRANRRSNIHLYPDDWKKLPIPDVSAAQQKPIIALVDQILIRKRANPTADISALETDLDAKVATLYGLTSEEIAIVEGTAK